jgi:hypothetical protein
VVEGENNPATKAATGVRKHVRGEPRGSAVGSGGHRSPSRGDETGQETGRGTKQGQDILQGMHKGQFRKGRDAGFGRATERGVDEKEQGVAEPQKTDEEGHSRIERGWKRGGVGVDGQDKLGGVVEEVARGKGMVHRVGRRRIAQALGGFVDVFGEESVVTQDIFDRVVVGERHAGGRDQSVLDGRGKGSG